MSNSAAATGGRITWMGRNSFAGPGMRNIDFRAMRDIPLRERVKLQLLVEAFNVFNHTNIFAVNTTAYSYTAPGAAGCTAVSNPAFNGCLIPNPAFMTPTSSSSGNGLFGARQIQLSGKLNF